MTLLDKFKKFLIDKGYKTGDKIATEAELAKHFGVSRNKIREATITLSQLGILDKKARRGTILKSLDPESISNDLKFRFSLADFNPADFQEARSVIEKAILPLAIKRITPALLNELENSIVEMEDNLDVPEKADIADRKFHMTLLAACGNQTLQAFGRVIESLFNKEKRQKYWTKENFLVAVKDHNNLIKAIKSSDIEQALDIMSKHFKY
jgi:DNA-binding FadR family transcriptional regulator